MSVSAGSAEPKTAVKSISDLCQGQLVVQNPRQQSKRGLEVLSREPVRRGCFHLWGGGGGGGGVEDKRFRTELINLN